MCRPFWGLVPVTPESSDLVPEGRRGKPSATRPRFNNSRIAEARLGTRCLKRNSSRAINSSGRQHNLKPFAGGFTLSMWCPLPE